MLLVDGQEFLRSILEDIKNAKRSIFVEYYIFEMFPDSEHFLNALIEKASEGIDIHFMVDGFGSWNSIEQIKRQLLGSEVKFKVYNPIPSWLSLVFSWRRLNKRNHRKVLVVDQKIAYIGSHNFSKSQLVPEKGNLNWLDLTIRLCDSRISHLHSEMLRTWGLRDRRGSFADLSNELFRLPTNLISRFNLWRELLKNVRHAKSEVKIANAYFIPHRTFLNRLLKARKRGVEVTLFLSGPSDVPQIKWIKPLIYPKLIRAGVKIFEVNKRILHTKLIQFDNMCFIGSHNLNYRSLLHDLEIEVRQEAKVLEDFWLEIERLATPVQIEEFSEISIFEWIKCRLILMIKYFV